jgi:hypothetical protein
MECVFGSVSVPAVYVNSTQVVCVSPPHAVEVVSLVISQDGLFSGPLLFTFSASDSSGAKAAVFNVISQAADTTDAIVTTTEMDADFVALWESERSQSTTVSVSKHAIADECTHGRPGSTVLSCLRADNHTIVASTDSAALINSTLFDNSTFIAGLLAGPLRSIQSRTTFLACDPFCSLPVNPLRTVLKGDRSNSDRDACSVDGSSCLSSGLDSLGKLAVSQTATLDLSGLDDQISLVIESVEPNLLDPSDGTWLRITGLGFTNSTRCLINNITAVPAADYLNAFSTVSSTLMFCYIQKMAALRAPAATITLYEAGRRSANSAELYFLDRLSFQRREKAKKSASPSPVSVPTSMMLSSALAAIIGTDICVSSSCVAATKAPACGAINPTWSDYLLSSELLQGGGDQPASLSVCSGRKSSNFSKPTLWNSTNTSNASTIMLRNVLSTYDSIPSTEDYTGTVIMSLPAQERANNSAASVFFYGTGFSTHDRWCARFNRLISECLVQSSTAIQCPIDTYNSAPGIRTVELLHICLISIANHTVTILPVSQPTDDVPISFVGSLSAPSTIDWGEVPRAVNIKPSSGPVGGLTRVTVFGSSMHDVDACRFTMADSNASVTVPALFNFVESTVFCNTTSMPAEGLASVELSYNSVAWIPTDQVFKFYREPLVYQINSVQFDANGAIPIFGELFPASLQAYCKIGLSTGVVMLVSAEVVSSRLLLCGRLPYRVVHAGMVSSVQLSFNGENFIAVKMSSVSPASQRNGTTNKQSSFTWRTIAPASLSPPTLLANLPTDLLQSISLPSAFDLFCDGTSSLPVSLGLSSQSANYTCVFDSTVSARGLRVGADTVICPIPSRRPGVYTLLLERESIDQLSPEIPRVVHVTCVTRPTILSAKLLPVASNGANEVSIAGFNLAASTDIFCSLDDGLQVTVGIVSETTNVACLFPSIVPGMHQFKVLVSQSAVLFQMNVCFSETLLVSGGLLAEAAKCDIAMMISSGIFPSPPISTKTYDFSYWWPQIGSTVSSTDVEVIAANVEYGHAYTCIFGDEAVPATVVSTGRLVCASPPHQQVGNVTLSVKASSGDAWIGAWFSFISEIKITDFFPSMLSYDGGDVVVLSTAFLPSELLDFYCHIGSQVAPAFREGANTLSCVSPMLSTSTVQVAIGSGVSVLSNVVSIPVASGQSISSMFPRHGSYRGGTAVSVAVPGPLIGLLQDPTCSFNGTNAVSAVLSEDKSTLKCVTPAFDSGFDSNDFGVVSVELVESSSHSNSPSYSIGSYSVEAPADVGTVSPSTITRNSSADLLVQGSFRRDTPDLACHLETEAQIEVAVFSARWLSDTLVLCSFSAETSLRLPSVPRVILRISTNGQDKSLGSASISIRSGDFKVDVRPQTAFTSGSGPVFVSTSNAELSDAYHCNFGGNVQLAYKVSNSTFICVAPTHPAGVVELVVSDEAASSNSVPFTYVDLPTIKSVTPSILLSSKVTNVIISGDGFGSEKNITGRFRRPDGSLVAGNCGSGDNNASVLACQVRPNRDDDVVILDMTINGVDYKTNMLTLQTFSPNAAVSIKPLYLFSTGGSHIEFTILPVRRTAFALSCRFIEVGEGSEQLSTVATVAATMLADDTADCLTPPLPLGPGAGKKYAFTIEQSGVPIFGPLPVDVSQAPQINSVSPSSIFSGSVTPILVTFRRPCFVNFLSCEIQGAIYSMRFINATAGLCAVQPLLAGNTSLTIRGKELHVDSQQSISIIVIDPPADVSGNASAILRGVDSAISFTSQSCSLPTNSICVSTKDRTVDVGTVSVDPCEVVCSISAPQSADKVLASLCVVSPAPSLTFRGCYGLFQGLASFQSHRHLDLFRGQLLFLLSEWTSIMMRLSSVRLETARYSHRPWSRARESLYAPHLRIPLAEFL